MSVIRTIIWTLFFIFQLPIVCLTIIMVNLNGRGGINEEPLMKEFEFTVCLLSGVFLVLDFFMFFRFFLTLRFIVKKKIEKIQKDTLMSNHESSTQDGLKPFHKMVVFFTVSVAILDIQNEIGNFVIMLLIYLEK